MTTTKILCAECREEHEDTGIVAHHCPACDEIARQRREREAVR